MCSINRLAHSSENSRDGRHQVQSDPEVQINSPGSIHILFIHKFTFLLILIFLLILGIFSRISGTWPPADPALRSYFLRIISSGK